MAEITMCTSKNCPVRSTCYRQCAKVSENQSWCDFEYTCNKDSGFEDYLIKPVKKNTN